jgi:hypothetical protein
LVEYIAAPPTMGLAAAAVAAHSANAIDTLNFFPFIFLTPVVAASEQLLSKIRGVGSSGCALHPAWDNARIWPRNR